MASSEAKTVATYLAELPADRRKAIAAARALVRKHLPKGYKEGMGYGMITWTIPLSAYPDTYNKQPLCYVALAAQKNYNTLYLMSPYADPKLYAWLAGEFKKAGKTFDMGKSCLHFKTMDDLVRGAVARVIAGTAPAKLIKAYEISRKRKGKP
jgi:Domain of unknown function (DU1801)